MKPFTFQYQAGKVVFGAGSLQKVAAEMDALGAKRALVLSTPEQRDSAQQVAALLGDRAAGIFDRAVMHVPIEVAREARVAAKELGADCAVAIGGGSTVGLGKAIALESSLPILAIPTTYAGSEMTTIYGITEAGVKKTGKDSRVLPRTVIYDPELTLGLPLGMSITSGMNAIAHAAEALYAHDGNPIISLMAQDGIRALAQGMPRLKSNLRDNEARAQCQYGAWMCGTVLGNISMGLHHKLCHTLGGSFNLPHAETHTVVLPHAMAYNAAHAPEAMAAISHALGLGSGTQDSQALAQAAPGALFDLAKDNGAPVSLKALGMPESGLDRVADLAAQNQYPNPRPLERGPLRALLQNAWEGRRP
jgi:maleylacetate reductase